MSLQRAGYKNTTLARLRMIAKGLLCRYVDSKSMIQHTASSIRVEQLKCRGPYENSEFANSHNAHVQNTNSGVRVMARACPRACVRECVRALMHGVLNKNKNARHLGAWFCVRVCACA